MTEDKNQQYHYWLEKNIFSKETIKDFKAKFPNGRWLSCWHIYIQLKILGIRRGNIKSDHWFYSICADDFPELDNDTVYKNTDLLREAGYILKVKDPGEKEFKQFPTLELFYREHFVRVKNKSVCFFKVLPIKSKYKTQLEKVALSIIEEPLTSLPEELIQNPIDREKNLQRAKEAFKSVIKITAQESETTPETKTVIQAPETKPEIKKQSKGIKVEAWQQ